MCSSTSAQKTQSNELSEKSSRVASPATVTTRGYWKQGFSRSNAVTSAKYPVRSLEKCPSRAPISSTERPPLGRIRTRSAARASSGWLARYRSSSLISLSFADELGNPGSVGPHACSLASTGLKRQIKRHIGVCQRITSRSHAFTSAAPLPSIAIREDPGLTSPPPGGQGWKLPNRSAHQAQPAAVRPPLATS